VTEEIGLEVSALRVQGRGHVPAPEHPRVERAEGEPPVRERRPVWFDGAPHDTAVVMRDELRAGHRLTGPLVIEQLDTTTVVPPGVSCAVDERGNLLIDCRRRPAEEA
jgi:N-methylhydantoinase A